MPSRVHIILVVILCATGTASEDVCLSPRDGDELALNDSTVNLTSSYCVPLIRWPISRTTLEDFTSRDEQAQQNYQNLVANYYKAGKVDIECLGMARYFFCAAAYPTCNGTAYTIHEMCEWLCSLWEVRCGTADEFHASICQVSHSSLCKGESFPLSHWGWAIGVVLLVLLY